MTEALCSCFEEGTEAFEIAKTIEEMVLERWPHARVNAYGGAKVKLALYSSDGANKVWCGLQQAKDSSCIFYVHHLDHLDHERLRFTGKGKQAKQLRFHRSTEVDRKDLAWLIEQIAILAPY